MGQKERLNEMCPAAKRAGLGTKLDALTTLVNELRNMELYQAFSSGGLVIGSSNPASIKIASTITYLHNGIFCSKTTAEVAFTATTHDIAANATTVQEACYLLSLVANGDVTITKGTTATGAGSAAIPATPAGKTPIGYVRVAVAAGSTKFDASSDLLNAGHLTVTYVNLAKNFTNAAATALV